jgi:hypothetical protein
MLGYCPDAGGSKAPSRPAHSKLRAPPQRPRELQILKDFRAGNNHPNR